VRGIGCTLVDSFSPFLKMGGASEDKGHSHGELGCLQAHHQPPQRKKKKLRQYTAQPQHIWSLKLCYRCTCNVVLLRPWGTPGCLQAHHQAGPPNPPSEHTQRSLSTSG